MNFNENKNLIDTMLDLGEELLSSGAEVNRVEDTLRRMGVAYGAKKVNVFVITSSIVITLIFENDEEITSTRRIVKSVSTNLSRFEQLNNLSRICVENTPAIEDIKVSLKEITTHKPTKIFEYSGSILASGAFTIFFGGNIFDGIIASIFGAIICFLSQYFAPKCPNRVFYYFSTAFLVGTGICFVSALSSVFHADKIMIGDIMLLIPGIAITNSVRDMLIGDTLSGAMRFIESLIWAVAIAGGFMLAIAITGRFAI